MKTGMNGSGAGPMTRHVRLAPADGFGPGAGSARGELRRGFITLLLAAAMISVPSTAMATDSAEVVGREGGLGAAAALSSLVYGPAKLLYATGGLVVGAFAWAFTAGDNEVASTVFTRSLKGTYVITPSMLTGDESVEFIGREEDETRHAPVGAVASVQPSYTQPSYTQPSYTQPSYTTSTQTYSVPAANAATQGATQGLAAQPNYDDLGW